MDRYLNINQTNPTQRALEDKKPNPERSKFNLSRVVEQNVEIGRIHIIDCIETLPNDTFTTLNYIMSLQSRNPTLKRALTGMRVYVHAHYQRLWDIWEGAQNFIDMGNTGKIAMQIPTLETMINIGEGKQINLATPGSLIDELDGSALVHCSTRNRLQAPFGALHINENSIISAQPRSYGDDKLIAPPYAMYQMIYLNRYANRNMLQSNLHWVPENQMKFRLPYEAKKVAKLNYDNPQGYEVTDITGALIETDTDTYIDPNGKLIIPQDNETNVYLAMPRYRLKKGDYFTSGIPFSQLIRGDIPTIDLSHIVSNIDWSNVVLEEQRVAESGAILGIDSHTKKIYMSNYVNGAGGMGNTITAGNNNSSNFNIANGSMNQIMPTTNITQKDLLETLSKAEINVTIQSSIDMATLNALEAMTIFRQRMALTNGRYNEMIEAQYGYNPEAPINDPMYIGGFYFDITGQDIIQTSETNTTPMGSKVGRLDSGNAGEIGQFHAKDFGYIMVTMSIMPDSYYNSGLPRWTTRKRQDEVYFPIFNNLAPQAILNKEIFYKDDETTDNDIFAWTERYADYKQRQNRVKGLMQLENTDDSAYTMQHWYNDTPTLNNRWLSQSQENTDMGIFTSTNEPPFVLTCAQNVEVVRAMPYITMPAGLRGGKQ